MQKQRPYSITGLFKSKQYIARNDKIVSVIIDLITPRIFWYNRRILHCNYWPIVSCVRCVTNDRNFDSIFFSSTKSKHSARFSGCANFSRLIWHHKICLFGTPFFYLWRVYWKHIYHFWSHCLQSPWIIAAERSFSCGWLIGRYYWCANVYCVVTWTNVKRN